MNTYENFYRRIVITISVLLIAVCLPLSASALGVTKASKDSQSTEMRAYKSADLNCEHLHLLRSHSRGSDNNATELQNGFSETDPAYGIFSSAAIVRQASESPISQVIVGFAEEDPTANGFQSDESERNDTFIACHSRGDKSGSSSRYRGARHIKESRGVLRKRVKAKYTFIKSRLNK